MNVNLTTYLEQKETEIKTALISTVYGVGKTLKEVKEKLEGTPANFIEWVIKIGINPDSARKYMRYYEICEINPEKLKLLPQELILEYGKDDTPKQLKEKVESGNIKTAKELKELKKELNQIKPEYENSKAEIEKLKKEKHAMYQNMDKIIEAKERLELKIEHSDTRNISEFKGIFFDINTFISERITKAKHYLTMMDEETKKREVQRVADEINKILSLLC